MGEQQPAEPHKTHRGESEGDSSPRGTLVLKLDHSEGDVWRTLSRRKPDIVGFRRLEKASLINELKRRMESGDQEALCCERPTGKTVHFSLQRWAVITPWPSLSESFPTDSPQFNPVTQIQVADSKTQLLQHRFHDKNDKADLRLILASQQQPCPQPLQPSP